MVNNNPITKAELEAAYQAAIADNDQWELEEAERQAAEQKELNRARWDKEQARWDRRNNRRDVWRGFKQWFWDKFEFPIMMAFMMIVPGLVVGLPIAAIVLLLMYLGG